MIGDVGVVIPAFNAQSTIADAVSSAVRHLGGPVVVVDDGSSDETATIAATAGATLVGSSNQGASAARRLGLNNVDTPFVVFLDGDDILLPGISEAVKAIKSNPDVAVVGGGIERFGSHRKSVTRPAESEYDAASLVALRHSPWPMSASVWSRAKLLESFYIQPPPLGPRYAEDFEILIRGALVGRVLSISTPVVRYRMEGGKSSLRAREAVADSERVRGYYSEALRVETRRMTQAEQIRAATWRFFLANYYGGGPTAVLRMCIAQPRVILPVFHAVLQRLGRTGRP